MEGGVLESARRALAAYPLCDRCLGRLYARLAHGLSNKERGRSIKVALAMESHLRVRLGAPGALDELRALAVNGGGPLARLYAHLTGSGVEARPCYLCGGGLDEFIKRKAEEGVKLLRAYDVRLFVVGVRVSEDVLSREEEVRSYAGAEYGESIKAEIRREVGKLIQALDPGLRAEFDEPEATLLLHYPSGAVEVQVNSLLLRGRYWKLARNISQAYWPSPEGPRYFSVEQAAWGLLRLTGGERIVVHAAGREDVDARMLGTGRPLIIEVKAPRRRHLPLAELEEAANSSGRGLVEFRLEGLARRRDITLYKEESAERRKVYKALIAVNRPLTRGDLERLEAEFSGRTVLQRTPTRVLHRRPDVTRVKRVHRVSCRHLGGGIAECLIEADGGLYVKELVSGDGGRTTPSFSEVLGARAACVELDVLAVEGVRLYGEPLGGGWGRVELSNGEGAEGLQAQDEEAPEEAREGEGGYTEAKRDPQGVQGRREGYDKD